MSNDAASLEEKQGTLTDEDIALLESLIGLEPARTAKSINDEVERRWFEDVKEGSYLHN